MPVDGALFCVTGTALGTAISALAAQMMRKDQPPPPPMYPPYPYYHPQAPAPDYERGPPEGSQSNPSERKRAGTTFTGARFNDVDLMDVNAVSHGFSMEECKQQSAMKKDKHHERTPAEVLDDLQKGNTRFWMGVAQRPEKSAFERRALIMAQFPHVAVLGCADSRVPVEIVFDQGLGDMFVVRVAGNCLDTTTSASLQYAVCHLGVKVLLVMGHEGCGAIKAAMLSNEKIEQEPPDLRTALLSLKDGLDLDRLAQVQDPRAKDRESVVTNVKSQLYAITHDETIMAKVKAKELIVVGGFYEISSGIVDFFLEIADVKVSPGTPKNKKQEKQSDEISRTKSRDNINVLVVKPAPLTKTATTTLEVQHD